MSAFLILIRTFVLRDLLKNKVRSILTVLGVALGVSVMLAINLANQTALHKFEESIDIVSGKTTLIVRSTAESDLDEQALLCLQFLWDKNIKFTPIIDQLAVSSSSPHEVVQVFGVDMLADSSFRSLNFIEKKADTDGFEIFRKNAAYIGSELARRLSVKAGDEIKILVNDSEKSLRVAGVLTSEGIGKAFSGNVILMDISNAQSLYSMPGRISRIDMIVPPEDMDSVTSELKHLLPADLCAERPERRGKQVEKMLRSFQYNLTALSLIALLVGMFLIYNTMSISVIRRRWEIGTLRALGLSRVTVFALFGIEAGILGMTGSALGVAGGVLFAQYSVKAVSRTVQALYADQPMAGVSIEPGTLLLAFAAGTFLTIIAAIAPALEAVSIAPAEASRRASYERKVHKLAPQLACAGGLMILMAAVASLQPAVNGFPLFGYLAAALAVFGAAAFCPLTLDLLLKNLASFLARFFGMEARLAALSLHGALGRSSVAIASLMVGIAMMVSLAVMIGSFRQTVMSWVEQTLRADLWLEPATREQSNRTGKLSQEVESIVRRVEGVDAADAFVEFPIEYENEPCSLGAGELEVMRTHGNLMFCNGEKSQDVLSRVENKDAVIVSESFALKHKKKMGDLLTLAAPLGKFQVKIEGIYYDYASDSGYIILPRTSYRRHFIDRGSTTMAIFLEKTAVPEDVRQRIFAAVPPGTKLCIRTNRELKAEVMRVFDNTFSITYALHAISIAVAILGVMNALFALTMESRRELGIIKYLGASEVQVRKLVLTQAALLGTLGNCGGLAVGLVLSFLLIHVINKQSFGWTVQFALPLEFLLESFALIFLCSLASGLIPAKIAAKTPAPEVVRSE